MGRRKGPINWECSINNRDRNPFWKTNKTVKIKLETGMEDRSDSVISPEFVI